MHPSILKMTSLALYLDTVTRKEADYEVHETYTRFRCKRAPRVRVKEHRSI
jgi:hypothetical protein